MDDRGLGRLSIIKDAQRSVHEIAEDERGRKVPTMRGERGAEQLEAVQQSSEQMEILRPSPIPNATRFMH